MDKSSVKSLAIGRFDGLHLGHKSLIKELGNSGKNGENFDKNEKTGALFVISAGQNLTPIKHFGNFCNEPFFLYELSRLKNLSGAEFVAFLKSEFLNLEKIIVGYDFKFGFQRGSNVADLARLFCENSSKKQNKKVICVDAFSLGDSPVHSSSVREFLTSGEVAKAAEFLGRNYAVFGEVVSGQGLGGRELFATLNLQTGEFLLPRFGVYAGFCIVENKKLKAVCFVGNRLSTDGNFSVEIHVLEDFESAERCFCSSEEVGFEFVKFMRENRKFDDLLKLKTQISNDIEMARKILGHL